MKKPRIFTTAALTALLAVLAIASIAWAAYSATIQVEESSGTSYDMLGVTVPFNTTYYTTNGFFNSTGNDTRVKSGTDELPYMMADDRILFAMPLPASSSQPLDFTTGNSELTDFDLIFGDGGYFTVSDDATIELGGDGSIAWATAYLNTATSANLTYKQDAINIVTGSGNVTATIYDAATTVTYRPSAAGDETNLTPSSAANYQDNGDNNDGTWVSTTSATYVRDLYNMPDHSTAIDNARIDSVVAYFRTDVQSNGVNGAAKPAFKIGGTVYLGTEVTFTLAGLVTHSQTYATNPDTSVAWTWDDIDALQYGITLHGDGAFYARSSDIWLVVNYTPSASVSQTVAAGEHDLIFGIDTPFIWMATDNNSALPPVSTNLVMNAPLGQVEEYAAPGGTFTTIDATAITTTVQGAAAWSLNNGYSLDGAADYLEVANNAAITFTSEDFSAFAWVKPDDITSRTIFMKGSVAVEGWRFLLEANDKLYVYTYQAGAQQITFTDVNPVSTGVWSYVGFVRTGADITIYINGTVPTGVTYGVHIDPVTSARTLKIGTRDDLANYFDGIIGDCEIYASALTADQVLQNYNANKLKYLGTGDISTYSTLATVADNSNDYTFNESDAVSYAADTSITVGGVQVANYNPTTIISGTTLPDETGTGNDGTIVWGVNPVGVSVTLGSLTVVASATVTPTAVGPDAFPVGDVPLGLDTPGTPNLASDNPFQVIVNSVTENTNTPAILIWIFGAFLVVIIAFVLVWKHTQNQWMSSIAALAVIGVCISMAFIPMWVMYVTAIALVGLATLDRSPQF